MTYIAAAYLLALVYLSVHRQRTPDFPSLQGAWTWLALIPINQFVFALFRAANIRAPRDLALVEIWADGLGWLFLGISMFCLTDVFAPVQTNVPPPTTPPDGSGDQLLE